MTARPLASVRALVLALVVALGGCASTPPPDRRPGTPRAASPPADQLAGRSGPDAGRQQRPYQRRPARPERGRGPGDGRRDRRADRAHRRGGRRGHHADLQRPHRPGRRSRRRGGGGGYGDDEHEREEATRGADRAARSRAATRSRTKSTPSWSARRSCCSRSTAGEGAATPRRPAPARLPISDENLAERADPRAAPDGARATRAAAAIFDEERVDDREGPVGQHEELTVVRRTLDADRDGKPEEVRYFDAKSGDDPQGAGPELRRRASTPGATTRPASLRERRPRHQRRRHGRRLGDLRERPDDLRARWTATTTACGTPSTSTRATPS